MESRTRTILQFAGAGAGGAAAILSFPGYNLWPLGFVAMVPLLAALEGTTARRAVLLGCFAGFIANAGGFYWLVGCVRDYGDLPTWFAVICYLLLSAANGLGWGVFCWLVRVGRDDASDRAPWWLAPAAFTAVEFGWWTVFPAYFGAGLWKAPIFAQLADLTGIYGLSFLFVLTGVSIHEGIRFLRGAPAQAKPALRVATIAVIFSLCYGGFRLHQVDGITKSSESIVIGAAQSNIGAFTKRKAGEGNMEFALEELRNYQALSLDLEKQKVDLILWPETGDPFPIANGVKSTHDFPYPGYSGWPPATAMIPVPRTVSTNGLASIQTPMVIGAVTGKVGNEDFQHNSAVLIARDGTIVASSHKIFMVPFGEYLPFGKQFPKLYKLIPAISHMQPGDEPHPLVLTENGRTLRFGSLICYEDILPGYTRWVVRTTDPDIILNLTNDSWYGDSIEPTIHLALASFRAIEERRALVRSTNTGLTAFIDPAGRVVKRSGQHTREFLADRVPIVKNVTTLYRIAGDWIGWATLLATAIVVMPRWRARRRKTKSA